MSAPAVLIGSGDVLRTERGRTITVPPLKGRTAARLRTLDAWLIAEAVAELEAAGNAYGAHLLLRAHPHRLTDSERTDANLVLFGSERGATVHHLARPTPRPTPTREETTRGE